MAVGIGRSSITITCLTMLSVGLGVINQILIAKYYGTSPTLDSYLVASAIPFAINAIAVSLFSSIVVPSLTDIKHDKEQLSVAVSNLACLALTASVILMVCGVVGRRHILELVTSLRDVDLRLASKLAGYVWIGTGIGIFTSFLTSLCYLKKEFAFPAVLGLLPTMGTIFGAVVLGPSLDIEGLVMGWAIAMALALLALLPVLRKHDFAWHKCSMKSRHVTHFVHTLWPVAAGIAPFTVLPAIDAYWVSLLPEGSMGQIGYCTKIVAAIGTIIVSGIYVAILPYLSEDMTDGDYGILCRRLHVATKYVLVVTIPSATFLLFFSKDVVSFLLERGRFGAASVTAVSSLMPFYVVALVSMTPSMILSRGYVALRQSRQLGLLGCASVALYWIMTGIFSRHFSVYGIGLAYAQSSAPTIRTFVIIAKETELAIT